MTWRERRQLANLINEYDDIGLQYVYIEDSDEKLIDRVIDFFNNGSLLIYPAKSYFVAIIYAYYLSKYFDEDFYDVLNSKDLLSDDKYFIKYQDKKKVYDGILEKINNIEQYESIQKTLRYFKQEFLINE